MANRLASTSIDHIKKTEKSHKIEEYFGRIVFPLVINHNVVGFMTCFLTKEDKINQNDIDFISSVSSMISLSIDITMKNNSNHM